MIPITKLGETTTSFLDRRDVASYVGDIICSEAGIPRNELRLTHSLSNRLGMGIQARLALKEQIGNVFGFDGHTINSNSGTTVREIIISVLRQLRLPAELLSKVEQAEIREPLKVVEPLPIAIGPLPVAVEPTLPVPNGCIFLNLQDIEHLLDVKEIDALTGIINKINSLKTLKLNTIGFKDGETTNT